MSTNAVWNSYVKNTGSAPKNAFKLIVYSRRCNNVETLTYDEAQHLIDTHRHNKQKLSKNNKISPKSSKQNNKPKKKSNKKKIKNDSVSGRNVSNKSTTKSASNSKKKSKHTSNKHKNQLSIPSKLKSNKSRSRSVTTKSEQHSDRKISTNIRSKSKTKSRIQSKRKQTNKNTIQSSNKPSNKSQVNSKRKSKNINNKNKIRKKTLLIPSKPKLQNSSSHSSIAKSKTQSQIKSTNIRSGSKLKLNAKPKTKTHLQTNSKRMRSRSGSSHKQNQSIQSKNNSRESVKQKHKNNTPKSNLQTPKTKTKIRSKSVSIHLTNTKQKTNIKSKQKTNIKSNKNGKIQTNSINNKTVDKSRVNSVAHSISVFDENNRIRTHKKHNKNIASKLKLHNSFPHSKKQSHEKKQIKLVLSKSRNDINSVSATAEELRSTYITTEHKYENSIKFLKLSEIVEHVTSPQIRGTQNQLVLILTYCLYTSRKELLTVIFERLAAASDHQIEIKVFSLLRTWLKMENDFKDEEDLIRTPCGLSEFALHFSTELMLNTSDNELLQKLAKPIMSQISQPASFELAFHNPQMSLASAPIPIKPKGKNSKDLYLTKIDPTEIARQICLMEYNIFSKIKPEEFLKQKSSKQTKIELRIPNDFCNLSDKTLQLKLKKLQRRQSIHQEKESNQPNIDRMKEWFNKLVVWTKIEILGKDELSKRVKVLSNLLKICDKLDKFNNISSLCAIRAGLCSTEIHRLRKTWNNIPKKSKEIKRKLDTLFNLKNNQKNLRDRISIMKQPAIPHIGIFLGDIIFIHDGNDTFDKLDNKKINWNKMKLLWDRINWISMFQQTPFTFENVPIICEYLKSKMKMVPDEFLYNLSKSVEPPEKKKTV